MKLRKLQPADADRMLEWMRDESINQFFQFDAKNMTAQDALEFIEYAQSDSAHRHFAVADDQDWYLGTVSLKDIDYKHKKAEYAISLHPDAVGKGIAKFATSGILQEAFSNLGLHRVYLNVLTENRRAIRFYEKFGFVYEGLSKDYFCIRGDFCSVVWYRMLKEEFEQLR